MFVPRGYFPFDVASAEPRGEYLVVEIGDPYEDLVGALARASRSSGVPVRGFSEMTDADVASVTGLSLSRARPARHREYDEPFEILDPGRAALLLEAVERQGKRLTVGGTFYHIIGRNDKAAAVCLLTRLYRQCLGPVRAVGLGDAPNDAAFLTEVDVSIVVRSAHSARLCELVPNSHVTTQPGPAGWSAAVLDVVGASSTDPR